MEEGYYKSEEIYHYQKYQLANDMIQNLKTLLRSF
jgi:hypothetical protein